MYVTAMKVTVVYSILLIFLQIISCLYASRQYFDRSVNRPVQLEQFLKCTVINDTVLTCAYYLLDAELLCDHITFPMPTGITHWSLLLLHPQTVIMKYVFVQCKITVLRRARK